MARWLQSLIVAAACTGCVSSHVQQQPLGEFERIDLEPQEHEVHGEGKKPGGLHGRFLHITGMLDSFGFPTYSEGLFTY